jgi:hypothetical protein
MTSYFSKGAGQAGQIQCVGELRNYGERWVERSDTHRAGMQKWGHRNRLE